MTKQVAKITDAPLAGRYALRRPIATGGYARIFEAEDLKLRRLVAVKLVAPTLAPLAEATARLAREGRIAGLVVHPNVCALTDVGELPNGAPFLVFELLQGETLAARLERTHTVPVDQAVRITEQVLQGLDAVHACGIVHRDIKPENLFLTELVPGFPLVKILDFGASQVPGDELGEGSQLTSTGLVVGTAEYMSPEQLKGTRDFDGRTDVYSCGVVLYEMLAGERPFAKRPPHERLQAIGFGKSPPLSETAPRVPRAIARAVDVALSNDRERRHPNAAAFVMALRSPNAPPATSATRVLTTPTADEPPAPAEPVMGPKGYPMPVMPDGDDWDMPTRESGPPQAIFADEDGMPDSSATIARPVPPGKK